MLDQWARMCFKGNLINLHLVLIPFFKHHIAVKYVKLMSAIVDAMYSSWHDKLISINSDGENTMTGRTGGVIKFLEDQCTNPILQIWCVPHQLHLIVKKATHLLTMVVLQSCPFVFRPFVCTNEHDYRIGFKTPQRHHPMGHVRQNVAVEIEAPSPSASTCAR